MIVKSAPWDDRNLGLVCREITVTAADRDDAVLAETSQHCGEHSYCLIKFPQKRISLAHSLERKGFRFLEAQLDLHKNLSHSFGLAPFLLKAAEAGSFKLIAERSECEMLLAKLDGVFDSDRVCLDPHFGETVSTERYRSWIRDCFEKKEYHCAWINAGETPVGFFFMKETEDAADSALAGLFAEFKNKGFGPLIVSTHIDCARMLGKKKLVTRVSLNNIESLRMHLAFGYEISHANYVMRYIAGERI